MVRKGDVELGLDLWVLQPVPLREAEEGFVARMVAQGVGECVARSKVDAEAAKPLVELGIVGVAERIQIHQSGIGTPVEEQVQDVQAAQPQCLAGGDSGSAFTS